MLKRILLPIILAILPACTAVKVNPVQATEAITRVCILINPRVKVDDFVDWRVVQDSL